MNTDKFFSNREPQYAEHMAHSETQSDVATKVNQILSKEEVFNKRVELLRSMSPSDFKHLSAYCRGVLDDALCVQPPTLFGQIRAAIIDSSISDKDAIENAGRLFENLSISSFLSDSSDSNGVDSGTASFYMFLDEVFGSKIGDKFRDYDLNPSEFLLAVSGNQRASMKECLSTIIGVSKRSIQKKQPLFLAALFRRLTSEAGLFAADKFSRFL